MKLSEESKDFLDKNPAGKIEDLPNEIKGVFENTFEVAEKVLQHKKIKQKKVRLQRVKKSLLDSK